MQDQASTYDTLIILCCHAIYTGGPDAHAGGDPTDERQWLLQPFQRSDPSQLGPAGEGEHLTFLRHLDLAIQTTLTTPTALLVLSGGPTKPTSPFPNLAESTSYLHAALAHPQLRPRTAALQHQRRIHCDVHATDSLQNLLFPLLRFRQVAGRWPRRMVVVTHAFKTARFQGLHAPALRWVGGRVEVLGVDPPGLVGEKGRETLMGEERTREVWEGDMYGVGPVLGGKRRERGWKEERVEELLEGVQEESVRALVRWRGGESGKEVFPGKLPWEEDGEGEEEEV